MDELSYAELIKSARKIICSGNIAQADAALRDSAKAFLIALFEAEPDVQE